jgi:hypothetical protein
VQRKRNKERWGKIESRKGQDKKKVKRRKNNGIQKGRGRICKRGKFYLFIFHSTRLLVNQNIGPQRRILNRKLLQQKGVEKNYIMRILVICTPHQILFGR